MSKRTSRLLLEDILDSCYKILEYSKDFTFEEFEHDNKTIDAVIRNFEIIGEASNLLPESIKEKYTEVEWHRIKGFRNRIIHDYFGVDLQIIWKITHDQIPALISGITHILNDL
ncbi:MAG: DUF86 domain-containing protein [Bacteroidales bacterium]|nr:DUF86 domain-containing protein [Bacteroidales bacterium]